MLIVEIIKQGHRRILGSRVRSDSLRTFFEMLMSNRVLRGMMAITLMISAFGGAIGLYHYIAPIENARNLRLPGFRDFVCKGVPYSPQTESCGDRSNWFEADWGTTAYITVYGVRDIDEAKEIADFIVRAKKKGQQDHIQVNLQVFSVARSHGGRDPASYRILNIDL